MCPRPARSTGRTVRGADCQARQRPLAPFSPSLPYRQYIMHKKAPGQAELFSEHSVLALCLFRNENFLRTICMLNLYFKVTRVRHRIDRDKINRGTIIFDESDFLISYCDLHSNE